MRSNLTFSFILAFSCFAGACAPGEDAEDGDAAEAAALAQGRYTARIRGTTLTITGDDAGVPLALRLQSGSVLAVDAGGDGTADFVFDRALFDRITINAAGGDDTITMDESGGAFTDTELVSINAGNGNDVVRGGVGAETIDAGNGDDAIRGGRGADTVLLRGGDDTVLWTPGDGNDVVDGGRGTDELVVDTAGLGDEIGLSNSAGHLRLTRNVGAVVLDVVATETIELVPRGGPDVVTVNDLRETEVKTATADVIAMSSSGARLRITRNIGQTTTDTGGLEHVTLDARAGADQILVGDLDGTGVVDVRVDLGAASGLSTPDGATDRIEVLGTPWSDTIAITAEAGAAVVSGLPATVHVARPDLADWLVVNGGEGFDSVSFGPGLDTLLQVTAIAD